MRPRRLEEGDALVLRALEIMEHFDPIMWVIRAAEDPPVHGAPTLGGRHLLQVRDSAQEADPTVDQHALETEPRAVQRRVGGREASEGALKGGLDSWRGQRARVRGQSRELLYSIPTALCEEIARAATAELADRQSIPD